MPGSRRRAELDLGFRLPGDRDHAWRLRQPAKLLQQFLPSHTGERQVDENEVARSGQAGGDEQLGLRIGGDRMAQAANELY